MKPAHLLVIGSVILGTFLLFPDTSEATHSFSGPFNSLSGSCTDWPSPRVNLNWSLHDNPNVNSIEKQDLSAVRGFGTSWGFISCGGNSNCWGQAPVGRNQTSYTDANINADTTYTYRIKHDTNAYSFPYYIVTVNSCSCGGGCPQVDDSRFVSKTPGSTNVATGNQFSVTYSVQNDGTSTWTDPPYSISTIAGIPAQLTVNSVTITESIPGGGVTPNETIWLTVTMTPTTAGSYTIPSWRIANSGAPFGDTMPAHSVIVNTEPRGAVESIDCTAGLKGWTIDDDQPATALSYRVQRRFGGPVQWYGPFTASEPHPTPGNHGFTWSIPALSMDGISHNYRVFARDANVPSIWKLIGSRTITCYVPPVITINADDPSIPFDTATTIRWSVIYPTGTTCNATAGDSGWPGSRPASGIPPYATENLTTNKTYTLACMNPGGSDEKSTTVTVAAPPLPTAAITADQFCSAFGGTITWTYGGVVNQINQRLQVGTLSSFASGSVLFDSGWGVDSLPGALPGSVLSANAQDPAIGPGNTYYARVKVRDENLAENWSNTWTFQHPPRVDFDLVPETPVEGQPFDVIDQSFYGTAAPSLQIWDFGDGSPLQSGSPVTYTYPAAGSHTVTLTVTDINAQTCSDSVTFGVNKPIPGFKEVLPQ